MNIFIDTISIDSNIIIFDDNRQIIDSLVWQSKGKESSTLIPNIDTILSKNKIKYSKIQNIVVVNWPWSFTWVRTTCLVVNSLAFIFKCKITPLSYFDLFTWFPIIKASSKRDCFLKLDSSSKVEIISNEDLNIYLQKNNIKKAFWEKISFLDSSIDLFDNIDYSDIINKIDFKEYKIIKPLYIKKPNIS